MTKPSRSKEKIRVGDTDVPLFRRTTLTAAKNKLASPFGEMGLKIFQDGRIEEDVLYSVKAEKLGLIEVSGRTVRIIEGEFKGSKMNRNEFEQWVSENPAFLDTITDEVEIVDEPVPQPPAKKLPLSFFKPADPSDGGETESKKLLIGLRKS
jgi:hypothetical protein